MMTVPLNVEEQVIYLAQHEHIAPETVLELAMQSFIDNLEDRKDAQVADKAMAKLRSGEDVRLSMDDAMRLLDDLVD